MPKILIVQGIENLISRLPSDAVLLRSCLDDFLIQNPEKKVYYQNRACPCCGYMTLEEYSLGSFEICPICYWEDDIIQFEDPDYAGGANRTSLRIAQKNFLRFGACELRMARYVRQPTEFDVRDPRWEPEEN